MATTPTTDNTNDQRVRTPSREQGTGYASPPPSAQGRVEYVIPSSAANGNEVIGTVVGIGGSAATSEHEDPPPPYPSPRRARRPRHLQIVSSPSEPGPSQQFPLRPHHREEPTESTALLSPTGRQRSNSHGSVWSTLSGLSGSPSLAQTVYTFFDGDDEDACTVAGSSSAHEDGSREGSNEGGSARRSGSYWRPFTRKAYYLSFFHLLVVNFPMALLSWVTLFVFTLLGTTLLMVLPLGLLLCFIDLMCARLLSRAELSLQTTFHLPNVVLPSPPPIFTRSRESPSSSRSSYGGLEDGLSHEENLLLDETSFYKNSYAMFTDPTSYTTIFYFLVIKPPITILTTLVTLVLVVPLMLSVIGIPLGLTISRRMGVWQARVGVEGCSRVR